MAEHRCAYCDGDDHIIDDCPSIIQDDIDEAIEELHRREEKIKNG